MHSDPKQSHRGLASSRVSFLQKRNNHSVRFKHQFQSIGSDAVSEVSGCVRLGIMSRGCAHLMVVSSHSRAAHKINYIYNLLQSRDAMQTCVAISSCGMTL